MFIQYELDTQPFVNFLNTRFLDHSCQERNLQLAFDLFWMQHSLKGSLLGGILYECKAADSGWSRFMRSWLDSLWVIEDWQFSDGWRKDGDINIDDIKDQDLVEANDGKTWYIARVRFALPKMLFVHFLGWSSQWDIWIPRKESHVFPKGTHQGWRKKMTFGYVRPALNLDIRALITGDSISTK
jgi:hypothetical protein